MADDRVEKQVLVQNERGLHARAATQFVQLAAKFPCDVTIAKDVRWQDAAKDKLTARW